MPASSFLSALESMKPVTPVDVARHQHMTETLTTIADVNIPDIVNAVEPA
jgi:hypothetical protein